MKKNPFKEISGGPCVKVLDEELAKCNVYRQAYHSKSFIGNHVNKMLKVSISVTVQFEKHFIIKIIIITTNGEELM